MKVRAGLPETTGHLPAVTSWSGIPVMVSAGRLWDKRRGRFRAPGLPTWAQVDVALDSAGFVALTHHGGYPWSVEDYVELVAVHRGLSAGEGGLPSPWSWWSQMDLCCEPEIASDRGEVLARVEGTGRLLEECLEAVEWWRGEGDTDTPDPTPVLQGWLPEDYLRSAELADRALRGEWPSLVGVGSVCRRKLGGPAGLLRVVEALDRALPGGVGLHLFGVKSAALPELAATGRVSSVDSMAWDFHARKESRARGVPASIVNRGEVLVRWWMGQRGVSLPSPQLDLFR